jgi:multiple sugar transport system permease protein
MTRSERQNLAKGLAFLSPWLIGFFAFMLLPIILSFYYSLCEYSLLQPPMYIGAANYRELARDGIFWQSLGNTLYFAAIVIPSSLILSLGLALLLNVKVPGQGIFPHDHIHAVAGACGRIRDGLALDA